MNNKHYHLKVRNIVQETEDAISIEFENPTQENILYKPGQFLTLILNINGESLRRAYSLCTSPLSDEYMAVTVKRTKNGKVSNYLNENLKKGDEIEILEPTGMFTTEFDASQKRHLVLFGGGSGITPLMAILKTALVVEAETKVSLIYANRDSDSIIFKKQIEALQQNYKTRLQVVHVLEKAPLFWTKGYKGLLNTKTIKKILDSLPQMDKEKTEYFMCGPAPMMDVIHQAFIDLKLPLDKLRKESFGLSPEEAAQKRAELALQNPQNSNVLQAREVKVIYAKEEFVFTVPPDKSILDTALSLDIDLPYSCRSGMCTACMGKCTSGKVKLDEEDALTPKELQQGYVLTCVGHPLTDDVVIEID